MLQHDLPLKSSTQKSWLKLRHLILISFFGVCPANNCEGIHRGYCSPWLGASANSSFACRAVCCLARTVFFLAGCCVRANPPGLLSEAYLTRKLCGETRLELANLLEPEDARPPKPPHSLRSSVQRASPWHSGYYIPPIYFCSFHFVSISRSPGPKP